MQETEATMIDVAPREQRGRRRVAQPVDVVVDRRVLLDVEVGLRDVGLGLVVVVVGDEVLDRVLREELAELVAELRGERLVVGDHERRLLHLLDDPRHRGRLARARRAEQGLIAVPRLMLLGERRDRLRLVAGGLYAWETLNSAIVSIPSHARAGLIEAELVRVRLGVDVARAQHLVDVLLGSRGRRSPRPFRAIRPRSPARVVRGERESHVPVLVQEAPEVERP